MKTGILLASFATAVVVLAGCSKNEIYPQAGNGQPQAIHFGSYLALTPDLKGLVTDNAAVQQDGAGIGVSASYTGQSLFAASAGNQDADFMYNQQLLYSGGGWSYSPVKYWPATQNDKLSFFAYAPYNGAGIELTGNGTAAKANELTFSLQDDPSKTVDFVAAGAVDVIGGPSPQPVNFKLKHELTRMTFQAKTSEKLYSTADATKRTKIVIKEVKLDNTARLHKSAKYTYGAAAGATGTWSGYTPMGRDYDLSKMMPMEEVKLGVVPGQEYNIDAAMTLTETSPVDLFNGGHYLYLIPVDGTAGVGTLGDVTVTFVYDIVTESADQLKGYSIYEDVTKTVKLPVGTLVQGKSYKFIFTFSLTQVQMAPEVIVWDTDDFRNATIDYNVLN